MTQHPVPAVPATMAYPIQTGSQDQVSGMNKYASTPVPIVIVREMNK
jgi:hypothetical protein